MAQRDSRMLMTGVAVALVAAIALSACGRKGPLEAPPGATVTDPTAASTADPTAIPRPDKPFILDPLLD